MNTAEILRYHISRYPGLQVEDALKLLYQGEMGGAHLLANVERFTAALRQELAQPGLFSAPAQEADPVNDNLLRVHLAALEKGPSADTLSRLCVQAAQKIQGSLQVLQQKAAWLQAEIEAGRTPWPKQESAKVADWVAQGCPQPHHSAHYTQMHQPHYRLLGRDHVLYLPVFAAIDAALAQKEHVLVCIDGMSTAGKSRLAALLQGVYGCGVVHADDFFLQPHQRTAQRLAQPGGNIDYERLAPVAQKAAEGCAFSYVPYNCAAQALQGKVTVPQSHLTVLEGVYSLHPQVEAPADIRVFLSVSSEIQAQRVQHRSPQMAHRFLEEWIPMEHAYHAAFAIREGCDIQLDTSLLGV